MVNGTLMYWTILLKTEQRLPALARVLHRFTGVLKFLLMLCILATRSDFGRGGAPRRAIIRQTNTCKAGGERRGSGCFRKKVGGTKGKTLTATVVAPFRARVCVNATPCVTDHLLAYCTHQLYSVRFSLVRLDPEQTNSKYQQIKNSQLALNIKWIWSWGECH